MENLRKLAYSKGSSRQLFFADIISTLFKRKIESSTWHCLPLNSEISVDEWIPYLKKDSFIRELWPAQRFLASIDFLKENLQLFKCLQALEKQKQ